MKIVKQQVQQFKNTKRPQIGASLVEYALLVTLICLVALGSISAFGHRLSDNMMASADRIDLPAIARTGGGTESSSDEKPAPNGPNTRR